MLHIDKMRTATALLFSLLPVTCDSVAASKSQGVLEPQNSFNPPPKKTATLPITNRGQWLYTTEIGIGSPPQKFQAIIDTSFSDVMVTSVGCNSRDCRRHPLFNGSKSSTYLSDGHPVHVHPGLAESWGNVSLDSYWVGDIQVEYEFFEEATKFDISALDFFAEDGGWWYDASLPLSRKTVHDDKVSSIQRSSPFMNMVSEDLLVRNEFTLKLPRKTHETGSLMLGHRGDGHDVRTATALPLTPEDRTQWLSRSGGWQVEPVFLGFSSGPDVIYYDLEGYTAIISSFGPWLEFPKAFKDGMFERLKGFGLKDEASVKCDRVTSAMPNLTIALRVAGGSVQEFTLTPRDYALDTIRLLRWEWDQDSDECDDDYFDCAECTVAVESLNEDEADRKKYISLGSLFLRKFLATFSEEERAVICKYLGFSVPRATG